MPLTPDPLGPLESGDDDPIGPFDPDNICNAQLSTGTNSWNETHCNREPHPDHWPHVATVDDLVDAVWRGGHAIDLAAVVLTDEGVVCRECSHRVNVNGEHLAGCKLSPRASA